MLLFLILVLCVVLFAGIDVWYFVRGFILVYGEKRRVNRLEKLGILKETDAKNLLEVHNVGGIVLPSDLDYMFHMNNSKYLRECDFGRFRLFYRSGLWKALGRKKATSVLAASTIRYRRSLQLFQRYTIKTRIVHWTSDSVYLEQCIEDASSGFVHAVMFAKMAVIGAKADDVIKDISDKAVSPPPSDGLREWMEYNRLSSEKLRRQTGKGGEKKD